MTSCTALVPADKAIINLAHIHRYNLMWAQVLKERARYKKLYEQVLTVCNLYFDAHPELTKVVINTRREIRMQIRGTPATIAMDSITTAGYIPNGTEQLYNAQAHLLKAAYRSLAPLVHPDLGGSTELFQEVQTAYRLRDYTFLQELFLRLTKDSLFWRSSPDSVLYCQQEQERPSVSLNLLQKTYEFQIVRQHALGKPKEAAKLAEERLTGLIVELQRELNHMINSDTVK